jgi:transposase
MTQAQTQVIAKSKISLLQLAEKLKNVSEACRLTECSRTTFYDYKKKYQENGWEGLIPVVRQGQPNLKNRINKDIEEKVLEFTFEKPVYGQQHVANELKVLGVDVSGATVRNIWLRHNLETKGKRLKWFEEELRKRQITPTDEQLYWLEQSKLEQELKSQEVGEIETHHPGYLLGQDTYYFGVIKKVGRIYMQTVIDTFSNVGFAMLFTSKKHLNSVAILHEKVLPFFEENNVSVLRILTDNGTEYCGNPLNHKYEIYLNLNDIEHSRTRVKTPRTNGACERLNQTILNEFIKIYFRKKIYESLEDLQKDLDEYMYKYNFERTNQGKRCKGRTPYQTFKEGIENFEGSLN